MKRPNYMLCISTTRIECTKSGMIIVLCEVTIVIQHNSTHTIFEILANVFLLTTGDKNKHTLGFLRRTCNIHYQVEKVGCSSHSNSISYLATLATLQHMCWVQFYEGVISCIIILWGSSIILSCTWCQFMFIKFFTCCVIFLVS